MKLHYMKKYSGDPDSLPHGEHMPGAVKFKEAENTKQMAIIANTASVVILIILAIPAVLRIMNYISANNVFIGDYMFQICIGACLPIAILFPHEMLHAICFREDVYLYTNLRQGMLFVVGPETMTKERFIFMSLLPNMVFGIIPYLIGLVFPQWGWLLMFGALATSMGAGDYYNVYNAITQMPKGARTYLYKFNSYWYMPDGK